MFKFTSLIVMSLCLLMTGCAVSIDSSTKSASETSVEYGSFVLYENLRAIDVSNISYAKIYISGTGIEEGSEPSSDFVSVTNGTGKATTINNIPIGPNRIVSVQAYDSSKNLLEDSVIRAVTEIKAGSNTCAINRSTTPKGNVFYKLNKLGYDLSTITSSETSKIEACIDSSVDFDKINTDAIAIDYTNKDLKDSKTYVIEDVITDYIEIKVKGYSHVWAWNADNAKENYTGGNWPGMALTKDGDYYTGTIDAKNCLVILSNNGGSQNTKDGDALTAGSWIYEGSWKQAVEDKVSPSISLTYPSDNDTVGGVTSLKYSASDNVGVTEVEVFFNTTSFKSSSTTGFDVDLSELSNGEYTVYAVAKDASGNTSKSSTRTVIVDNGTVPLSAKISASSSTYEGGSISFDASSSKGDITSYSWSFGDGSTATGSKVSHTFTTKGSYTVILTITGSDGSTSNATLAVKVVEKGSFNHRDFRNETVYFMMTDRFADGDKSNNNIWGDEYLPNGESQLYEYSEDKTGVLSYYHGGDFKGIIDNLDYIKDMGFTAIWITPSVKQPEGRYYYDGSNGGDAYQASAFHGYWGYDFDKIDPHLHSSGKDSDGWDDFKAFVDACHAKGIRVMQDIVVNHGNHTAATAPTKWADYSVQTIMDGKEWAWKTLDPYYESDTSKNGFYSYYGFGQCADLIDFGHLGEDGKDSRQHIINVYKKFIDAGVDAFRIDTMAYIPNEFAGEFADAMYNHAKSLGNDYFYMIGEAWCGRYDAVARHSMDTTESLHMLDMHLSCLDYPGQMYSAFGGGNAIGAIYDNVVGNDKQFSCMTPEEYTKTAMFVDNHDCYRCDGRFSEAQYKNALNYIYLFRGVPIVYYGTEALYSWEGTHPTTNKDDVGSRWMLGDRGINYVKTNTPGMYKHLKVLNEVYHSSDCIAMGVQENVSINTIPSAFTRTYGNKTAYVVLNYKDGDGSYTFSNVNSGTYTLYTSDGSGSLNSSTVQVSGSYELKAPSNGFAVLDPQ